MAYISYFITLQSSSSRSVKFHPNFCPNNCLIRSIFWKSSSKFFAIYCFARKVDFNSLLHVGGFNCKIAFFVQFYSVLAHLVSWPSCCFLRKSSNSVSFALYPAAWSFSGIWTFVRRFLPCPIVAIIILSSDTCVWYFKVLSILFLEYCRVVG